MDKEPRDHHSDVGEMLLVFAPVLVGIAINVVFFPDPNDPAYIRLSWPVWLGIGLSVIWGGIVWGGEIWSHVRPYIRDDEPTDRQ